ncbi:MAG: tetratricopeptide repeat protein [Lacunisphaera sp.]
MKRFLRSSFVAVCLLAITVARGEEEFDQLLAKAHGGDVDAMREVSTAYEEGTGVRKNLVEALRWRRQAAEKGGEPWDQLAVGVKYADGLGTKPDAIEAVKWLQLAIAQDDIEAIDKLNDGEVRHGTAMILFQGGYGVPADRPRAVRLLTAAADGGLRESQYELGRALVAGIPPDLPADPPRGVELLRKAANQHKIEAVVSLGQIFEKGAGVPANPAEALFWYKKAYDAGVDGAKDAVDRVQKLVPAEPAASAPPKKN